MQEISGRLASRALHTLFHAAVLMFTLPALAAATIRMTAFNSVRSLSSGTIFLRQALQGTSPLRVSTAVTRSRSACSHSACHADSETAAAPLWSKLRTAATQFAREFMWPVHLPYLPPDLFCWMSASMAASSASRTAPLTESPSPASSTTIARAATAAAPAPAAAGPGGPAWAAAPAAPSTASGGPGAGTGSGAGSGAGAGAAGAATVASARVAAGASASAPAWAAVSVAPSAATGGPGPGVLGAGGGAGGGAGASTSVGPVAGAGVAAAGVDASVGGAGWGGLRWSSCVSSSSATVDRGRFSGVLSCDIV